MPTLTKDGPLWIIELGAEENRFTPEFLSPVEEFLHEVASDGEPAALCTIGAGKFYSNGLDLDWLGAHPDQLGPYVQRVQALLATVLTLPVPTVAAVNGHAFGAGAMLAMAHDSRVMRQDRGYFCFPEVDIDIPFTPGMTALLKAKLTARTALDAMTTGRRHAGPDALAAGLVDRTSSAAELRATATGLVRPLAGKNRATLGAIKAGLFADAVTALRRPPA